MNRWSGTGTGDIGSSWRRKSLWLAVLVAALLRLGVWTLTSRPPTGGLELGYLETVASWASGRGLLMRSESTRPDASGRTVVTIMQSRQAEGQRIDRGHPYPQAPEGWLPATNHPAGYAAFLYGLYLLANYDGLVVGAHVIQIVADALACALIFLFAGNLFDRRIAIWSAWVYALLPPAIVMSSCFLLPDALCRFLMILVLCLASYAVPGRGWMLVPAGAALGLACHFRPDFLLLPVALVPVLWAWRRRLWTTLAWMAGMAAAFLIVMSPWLAWTQSVIGKPLLSTTAGGGSMYEALGQAPNRWGILADDTWLARDAVKNGLSSPWSLEGDLYYSRRFRQCVAQAPAEYAKLVLVYRLPMALAPPYILPRDPARAKVSLMKFREDEGLSYWGVIRRYPGVVLRNYWLPLSMSAVSGILTLSLLVVAIARRRDWRYVLWLLFPWAYIVGSMCMVKQIEPRNVSPVLVVQAVALAVVMASLADRAAASRYRGPVRGKKTSAKDRAAL
jgi:4-amino-4-deoxy-L-arabinose transferase-like glycosyltransferase